MHPRPIIYVSRITNLSDARYCAGMGADLLGFVIDPADPDFVSAETFQQLIGWVSGPARVAECGVAAMTDKVQTEYSPDFLHLTFDQFTKFQAPNSKHQVPTHSPAYPTKLIVEIPYSMISTLSEEFRDRKDIAYWLVTDAPDVVVEPMQLASPILIARNQFPGAAVTYLQRMGATGVALRGSAETVPGLKDYDHLAQVLEELNS